MRHVMIQQIFVLRLIAEKIVERAQNPHFFFNKQQQVIA